MRSPIKDHGNDNQQLRRSSRAAAVDANAKLLWHSSTRSVPKVQSHPATPLKNDRKRRKPSFNTEDDTETDNAQQENYHGDEERLAKKRFSDQPSTQPVIDEQSLPNLDKQKEEDAIDGITNHPFKLIQLLLDTLEKRIFGSDDKAVFQNPLSSLSVEQLLSALYDSLLHSHLNIILPHLSTFERMVLLLKHVVAHPNNLTDRSSSSSSAALQTSFQSPMILHILALLLLVIPSTNIDDINVSYREHSQTMDLVSEMFIVYRTILQRRNVTEAMIIAIDLTAVISLLHKESRKGDEQYSSIYSLLYKEFLLSSCLNPDKTTSFVVDVFLSLLTATDTATNGNDVKQLICSISCHGNDGMFPFKLGDYAISLSEVIRSFISTIICCCPMRCVISLSNITFNHIFNVSLPHWVQKSIADYKDNALESLVWVMELIQDCSRGLLKAQNDIHEYLKCQLEWEKDSNHESQILKEIDSATCSLACSIYRIVSFLFNSQQQQGSNTVNQTVLKSYANMVKEQVWNWDELFLCRNCSSDMTREGFDFYIFGFSDNERNNSHIVKLCTLLALPNLEMCRCPLSCSRVVQNQVQEKLLSLVVPSCHAVISLLDEVNRYYCSNGSISTESTHLSQNTLRPLRTTAYVFTSCLLNRKALHYVLKSLNIYLNYLDCIPLSVLPGNVLFLNQSHQLVWVSCILSLLRYRIHPDHSSAREHSRLVSGILKELKFILRLENTLLCNTLVFLAWDGLIFNALGVVLEHFKSNKDVVENIVSIVECIPNELSAADWLDDCDYFGSTYNKTLQSNVKLLLSLLQSDILAIDKNKKKKLKKVVGKLQNFQQLSWFSVDGPCQRVSEECQIVGCGRMHHTQTMFTVPEHCNFDSLTNWIKQRYQNSVMVIDHALKTKISPENEIMHQELSNCEEYRDAILHREDNESLVLTGDIDVVEQGSSEAVGQTSEDTARYDLIQVETELEEGSIHTAVETETETAVESDSEIEQQLDIGVAETDNSQSMTCSDNPTGTTEPTYRDCCVADQDGAVKQISPALRSITTESVLDVLNMSKHSKQSIVGVIHKLHSSALLLYDNCESTYLTSHCDNLYGEDDSYEAVIKLAISDSKYRLQLISCLIRCCVQEGQFQLQNELPVGDSVCSVAFFELLAMLLKVEILENILKEKYQVGQNRFDDYQLLICNQNEFELFLQRVVPYFLQFTKSLAGPSSFLQDSESESQSDDTVPPDNRVVSSVHQTLIFLDSLLFGSSENKSWMARKMSPVWTSINLTLIMDCNITSTVDSKMKSFLIEHLLNNIACITHSLKACKIVLHHLCFLAIFRKNEEVYVTEREAWEVCHFIAQDGSKRQKNQFQSFLELFQPLFDFFSQQIWRGYLIEEHVEDLFFLFFVFVAFVNDSLTTLPSANSILEQLQSELAMILDNLWRISIQSDNGSDAGCSVNPVSVPEVTAQHIIDCLTKRLSTSDFALIHTKFEHKMAFAESLLSNPIRDAFCRLNSLLLTRYAYNTNGYNAKDVSVRLSLLSLVEDIFKVYAPTTSIVVSSSKWLSVLKEGIFMGKNFEDSDNHVSHIGSLQQRTVKFFVFLLQQCLLEARSNDSHLHHSTPLLTIFEWLASNSSRVRKNDRSNETACEVLQFGILQTPLLSLLWKFIAAYNNGMKQKDTRFDQVESAEWIGHVIGILEAIFDSFNSNNNIPFQSCLQMEINSDNWLLLEELLRLQVLGTAINDSLRKLILLRQQPMTTTLRESLPGTQVSADEVMRQEDNAIQTTEASLASSCSSDSLISLEPTPRCSPNSKCVELLCTNTQMVNEHANKEENEVNKDSDLMNAEHCESQVMIINNIEQVLSLPDNRNHTLIQHTAPSLISSTFTESHTQSCDDANVHNDGNSEMEIAASMFSLLQEQCTLSSTLQQTLEAIGLFSIHDAVFLEEGEITSIVANLNPTGCTKFLELWEKFKMLSS